MYPVDFIAHDTRRSAPEVLVLARRAGAAALAIKPLSAGAWRRGETKTRHDGCYKVLGEQSEIGQAIRFCLSLDPVVSVLTTSFTELAKKPILAGKTTGPPRPPNSRVCP